MQFQQYKVLCKKLKQNPKLPTKDVTTYTHCDHLLFFMRIYRKTRYIEKKLGLLQLSSGYKKPPLHLVAYTTKTSSLLMIMQLSRAWWGGYLYFICWLELRMQLCSAGNLGGVESSKITSMLGISAGMAEMAQGSLAGLLFLHGKSRGYKSFKIWVPKSPNITSVNSFGQSKSQVQLRLEGKGNRVYLLMCRETCLQGWEESLEALRK